MYLTPEQAARWLRLSRSYLYELAGDGTLRKIKASPKKGSRFSFALSDLQEKFADRIKMLELEPCPLETEAAAQ